MTEHTSGHDVDLGKFDAAPAQPDPHADVARDEREMGPRYAYEMAEAFPYGHDDARRDLFIACSDQNVLVAVNARLVETLAQAQYRLHLEGIHPDWFDDDADWTLGESEFVEKAADAIRNRPHPQGGGA